jgi:hypothetical protein
MKFRVIVVLSSIFLNAALIFGQENILEQSAFQTLVEKAGKNLYGKTYRTINTYETFDAPNTAPVKSVKIVTERISPDRFRLIEESDGQQVEIIRVGEKGYIRQNNADWKEESGPGIIERTGCGTLVESAVYKVIENSDLDGKTVDLYEMTKKLNDQSCGDNGKFQSIGRYWISKDGLLLKTEEIYEDVEKTSFKRTITIYEHDPNIKIESPVE